MIDTNVYLSRWPCRRLPGDETPALMEKLRQHGVTQAWVGSFDALLHRDMAGVNARLAEESKRKGDVLLVPFGAVNPLMPDWEDDLRRCAEVHQMPGIRLHPNYHGYKLDDPLFAKLLAAADARGLMVQIALRMEDPRTQHRLLAVPDVDPAPLVELVAKWPKLKLQLLNAMATLRGDLLDKLIAAGQVAVEIAMLEGVNGVQKLLSHVPLERVLFGSYFPFFTWEAAELKLRESPLAEAQRVAIGEANAKNFLATAAR
jgi:uncharacterized protein